MFEIGDNIVCGSNGVCTVEDIGPLRLSSATKGRMYYTLKPVYDSAGTVFVPVDNDKIVLRFVLSKDEVMDLIRSIPTIDKLWITDEKKREQEYKDAISSCDCRKLIQIIKTLHSRMQKRLESGKKVTAVDDRYFRMAQEHLYEEFALALNISRDECEDYIRDFIEK